MTAKMDIAIPRRRMKLRFPQGSEVWTTDCPKFRAIAKERLTNPYLEAKTEQPELLRWRAVFAFPRS